MHKLLEYVCDELQDIEKKAEKGQLSMSEVEYADKLAHLKKNLLKGEEMMSEGGYSNRGYSRRYDDGINYSSRYSRARGRDSMGRYSRDGYNRDGYNRGYSMATDEMVAELRELMQDAPDDRTRQEFQSFISKIERM